jgi:hypothetical protein
MGSPLLSKGPTGIVLKTRQAGKMKQLAWPSTNGVEWRSNCWVPQEQDYGRTWRQKMADFRPRMEEAINASARMDAVCEFIEFWLGLDRR